MTKAQSSTFEQHVVASRDKLMKRAMRLCGEHARAEDLVQETMARALVCKRQFTPGTNLQAWLYTILRNRFLGDMRLSWNRLAVPDDDVAPVQGPGDAEVMARMREMHEALRTLPEEQRDAVLLVAEGYSYGEVAALQRINVGTVKSRVSRGRQYLRETLGEAA